MKLRTKILIVVIVCLLIIGAGYLLLTTPSQKQQSSYQSTPISSSPTPKIQNVETTPGFHSTQIYSGTYVSITFPSLNWKAAKGVICGEDAVENIAVYYTSVPAPMNPITTDVVTVCASKAIAEDGDIPLTYAQYKELILQQKQNGLVDTLTEQTVAGQQAIVYDYARKDFPGHYEKTIQIVKNTMTYKIIWSIETDNAAMATTLKANTHTDVDAIISSFQIK